MLGSVARLGGEALGWVADVGYQLEGAELTASGFFTHLVRATRAGAGL